MLNDSECISLRESLFEKKSKQQNDNQSSSHDFLNTDMFGEIETDQLLKLLSHLREYTQRCALNEDYKTAKKSRDLANDVRSELTKRGTFQDSLQDQKDETDARIRNFEDTWKSKRDLFNQETENKKAELEKRQAHDRRRFERVWNKEMPHKYRKPSSQLLQMKQIEKSLAIAGKIDEADVIHDRAEILSRKEMILAQEQLSRDYEMAKYKLLRKQAEERQNFVETRDHERNLMECQYIEDRRRLDNRDNVVTNRCRKLANKTQISDSVKGLPATLPRDKGTPLGTLLPPLIPPNDPNYVEYKKRKKEAYARKQREYQQKNAEETIALYSGRQIASNVNEQNYTADSSSTYTSARSEHRRNIGELQERTNNMANTLIDDDQNL
ncbi:hypothetical protein TRFO_11754 [Tritrichomonas foetus]|uniref:Uncharacterized protein n=1 Tax=Tritrichomonas foetus TaxID=1144522 RepID=A0A1J4J2E3_9EUKA|nr:hypothetical protein TRFO_11754 [Tritrichomonas foetus]|eukprot:OHS93538.1 hypothetical protein TRFO_11754 [Tritrichomonas foetus]